MCMFHKKWTCEVISKGIRHPISAAYGFVCGWSVGEGLEGFGEVTKSHCLREVGVGILVISLLSRLSEKEHCLRKSTLSCIIFIIFKHIVISFSSVKPNFNLDIIFWILLFTKHSQVLRNLPSSVNVENKINLVQPPLSPQWYWCVASSPSCLIHMPVQRSVAATATPK